VKIFGRTAGKGVVEKIESSWSEEKNLNGGFLLRQDKLGGDGVGLQEKICFGIPGWGKNNVLS